MRITGLKRPEYDDLDAQTIGLAAPTQAGTFGSLRRDRRSRTEPDKIAQIPAIGIKRVLLRSTDVFRNEVRSAFQSDHRRRLVMTSLKKPLAVLALGLAVTALASPSYAQRAPRDVNAARASALQKCSYFTDSDWDYAYRACMAEHGQAE
jgi:hypothetical protein